LANAVFSGGDVTFGDAVNSSTLSLTGSVNLTGSRIWNVASAVTVEQGITAGTAGYGLTKTGPGVLLLNGTNTYPGSTTVGGGTLVLTAADLAELDAAFPT
jgi:autotransporter-associated beta strand protein